MPGDSMVLREVPNAAPPVSISRGLSQERRCSTGLAHNAEQNFDEGRLASAVRTQQSEDCPALDSKRHSFQGLNPASPEKTVVIGFPQRLYIDHRVGHGGGYFNACRRFA